MAGYYGYESYVSKTSNVMKTVFYNSVEQLINSILQLSPISKNVVWTCGNGGSGSNASHFTQDLKKTCYINSFCLNDDIAFITATANDNNYQYVFSENLKVSGKEGDILVCFTGSGNSPNIIRAIKMARDMGMEVFVFVGFDGGSIFEVADDNVWVVHFYTFDMRIYESCANIAFHYVVDSIEEKQVLRIKESNEREKRGY
jgi:D-sedoheptulose 7-phosphate isomerase